MRKPETGCLGTRGPRGDLRSHGEDHGYPAWSTYKKRRFSNGTVEIVDLPIFHSFLYVDQRVNGRLSMANVRLNGQYPSDLRLKLEVPTIKENHVEVHFFCQKTIQKHLRVFSKFLFDTFFFLGSMGISGS